MKKILAKLICLMLIMSVALTGLVACSESNWKGGKVTLKNSGAVIENAGFIAETENYLYFINGSESTTANNKMGTPLKGALLVADKNDLSKTEVVVPKLFVASDYSSGVFIDGGYVYYATPSVEKNSEGHTANDELTFMRTKLDGSGTTDEFFTLDTSSAIATQYRIVKADNGQVLIYYYNADTMSIVCYNTSNKESSTVIKQKEVDDGDSLNKHVFLNSKNITDVIGYYTTTVYENKHETIYNRVYVIRVGSTEGELLVDGNNNQTTQIDDVKYSITLVKDGFIFFTKTNSGRTETYAISELVARTSDWSSATKIVNAEHVSATTLINGSLSEIYVVGDTKIYKSSFTVKDEKTPVALKENISKLLFVYDGYLYFYNAEGHIAKILLDQQGQIDDDKKIILVSEDTALTSWYEVEIKSIGGKDYLFYCDNSVTGKSYIKYVDLSADVIEKDTDDDDENDLFYLDTDKIYNFGKMLDKDIAEIFDSKVETQATYSPVDGIGANEEDDQAFYEEVMKLKTEYEGLSSSVKEKVTDKAKNTLECIEKAFEVAEKYKMLADIEFVGSSEEAEDLGIKAIYNQVKDYIEKFKKDEFRDGVEAFISDNLKAHYTKAVKLFEAED